MSNVMSMYCASALFFAIIIAVAYSSMVGVDADLEGPIAIILSFLLQSTSVFIGGVYLVSRVTTDVRRHCLIYGKVVLLFSLAFTIATAFTSGELIRWYKIVNLIIIIPSALLAQVFRQK